MLSSKEASMRDVVVPQNRFRIALNIDSMAEGESISLCTNTVIYNSSHYAQVSHRLIETEKYISSLIFIRGE